MKFEDALSVMKLSETGYDEYGNPSQASGTWTEFPKCFLSFNSAAQKVRLNDGSEYVYSYYVICPIKKALYNMLPIEGDKVRITKADGTVDKVMEVKGFVTYKKRYLKLWL